MERVCFTLRVDPRHIDRYIAMHADTWPELLDGLRHTGWQNYSLFLRGDGFLIGYVESTDWMRSSSEMAALPVSPLWSIEMDKLVVPGTAMEHLPLVVARGQHIVGARRVAALALSDEPPDWASVAVFRTVGGASVFYGEIEGDETSGLTTDEFVEVFNLDEQLARISPTRA